MYKNKYKELENVLKGVRLFKVGATNVYMIGHSIIDSICRSFDLNQWEQISSIDDCSLAEDEDIENYRFNDVFLNQVIDFNINLKIQIRANSIYKKVPEQEIDGKTFKFDELPNYFSISLIMSYSEENSVDLQQQLQNILNSTFQYNDGSLKRNI